MKVLVAFYFAAFATVFAQHPLHSTCILMANGGSGTVVGTVDFHQKEELDPVHITGEIFGLEPGNHGFHIHTNATEGDDCASASGHFNPDGVNHGGPTSEVRHVGDLGNIIADGNGTVLLDIQDTVISLFNNDHLITGRSVVVHELEDDLGLGGDEGSLTTGNAGARLACCTIEQR